MDITGYLELYFSVMMSVLMWLLVIGALGEYAAAVYNGIKREYRNGSYYLASAFGTILMGYYMYERWVAHNDPSLWYIVLGYMLGSPLRVHKKYKEENNNS